TGILKIPENIPLPIAATVNCAIATVAGAIRLAGDLKGRNVLIFGMGLLGISCVAMCREAGAAWIGTADISIKRLNDSMLFGADEAFDLSKLKQGEIVTHIQQKAGSKSIDVAFDMSGSPEAMETGVEMLTIAGRAVWVGAVFRNR